MSHISTQEFKLPPFKSRENRHSLNQIKYKDKRNIISSNGNEILKKLFNLLKCAFYKCQ